LNWATHKIKQKTPLCSIFRLNFTWHIICVKLFASERSKQDTIRGLQIQAFAKYNVYGRTCAIIMVRTHFESNHLLIWERDREVLLLCASVCCLNFFWLLLRLLNYTTLTQPLPKKGFIGRKNKKNFLLKSTFFFSISTSASQSTFMLVAAPTL